MELGADDYLTQASTAEVLGAIAARLEERPSSEWCAR